MYKETPSGFPLAMVHSSRHSKIQRKRLSGNKHLNQLINDAMLSGNRRYANNSLSIFYLYDKYSRRQQFPQDGYDGKNR
jgi:hypothetical protein